MLSGLKVSCYNHKLTNGHTIVNKLLGNRTALKIDDLSFAIHGITVSVKVAQTGLLAEYRMIMLGNREG